VLRLAVGRERFFEACDGAAEHELSRVEDVQHRGVDFRLDGQVLSFEVDERDQGTAPGL
jgi:hypothetical protein